MTPTIWLVHALPSVTTTPLSHPSVYLRSLIRHPPFHLNHHVAPNHCHSPCNSPYGVSQHDFSLSDTPRHIYLHKCSYFCCASLVLSVAMHSPFPFSFPLSWPASASSVSTNYQPLDDTSVDDTPPQYNPSRSIYASGSGTGLLSPVDEDVWSTFHFPSSPLPDDSDIQPGALSSSSPFTLPGPATASVGLSSASSPHLTPAIRHLRLHSSELPTFPSLNSQPASTASAASTPQRSSPGSPTVAAFLANPELLPKLLGRGRHQPQLVRLLGTPTLAHNERTLHSLLLCTASSVLYSALFCFSSPLL